VGRGITEKIHGEIDLEAINALFRDDMDGSAERTGAKVLVQPPS
jgi:hypothetical protein